jgi:hypothetical protein
LVTQITPATAIPPPVAISHQAQPGAEEPTTTEAAASTAPPVIVHSANKSFSQMRIAEGRTL